ncbi:coiled-coil domain-containing protein 86 [Ostrinia furnacalis]|uniref:coiled-coil domain-containing protein 86 n=1 Tax=Ostrinia furnacalis TaxID=93504 RepID=UPI00103863FD|nr:coiled-coil domain-containing protein 86 [Ostrinia furnacalis]
MANEASVDVMSIISNIKKGQDNEVSPEDNEVMSSDKTDTNEIRGKPKSGRFWKSKKEKFSSINKTKGLRQDFQKKTSLRLELKRTKELSKQVIEQLKAKEAERKERRRLNIQKAEENKRKSEVVQVITNTAKLKRMKKKQLRFIQKRDTNKEVEANK